MGSILGIILCLAFSAFFSASEIAFASVSKVRLRNKSESGNAAAQVAYYITTHFDDALTTILIGNNLVNIAASAMTTLLVMNYLGESMSGVAAIIMTILVLIFGEITPKIVAKKINDHFVLFAAYPLRFLMIVFTPLNKLVQWVMRGIQALWNKEKGHSMTEEELITVIESVEADGVIDEEASNLLQSAMEFSEINVEEITTPRVNLLAININDEMDEITEVILESPYSRIPFYEESIDNILGILYVNHFLKAVSEKGSISHDELREMLLDTEFIYESTKLPKVFDILKSGNMQMAIVVDEYGGTVGCITMEDVLEELVGDIWDENDVISTDFIQKADRIYEVSGDYPLRDFVDQLDLDDEDFESESHSLGGWMNEMLGELPKAGKSLKHDGLKLTVLEADEKRILRVSIHVLEEEEAKE